MPSLVIFGGLGQVGRCLAEAALPAGWERRVFDHAGCDITDPAAVERALAGIEGGAVVNAAAYTAVDRAETEAEAAFAINRDGAGIVAATAAERGLPLIHLSTDYVFDGAGRAPWREESATGPLGVYGASKLAGEEAVRAAGPRHVILRVQWVFAAHGGNFVRTMLRAAATRPQLRVVNDQIGAPTPAADIAATCLTLAQHLADGHGFGTFHYCGAETTSWHGFAAAILAEAAAHGLAVPPLAPIATADFPTPARRPAYSVFDCHRIAAIHGIAQPDWRRALAATVPALLSQVGGRFT